MFVITWSLWDLGRLNVPVAHSCKGFLRGSSKTSLKGFTRDGIRVLQGPCTSAVKT